MNEVLFLPFFLVTLAITAVVLIFVNGMLLKLSCWLFNLWFAGPLPVADVNETTSPTIPTALTAQDYADTEKEQQANPFSSPRHAAKPVASQNTRPRVVVPTVGVSFGLGFLLTAIQVALPTAVIILLQPILPTNGGLAISFVAPAVLAATFAATAGLISALLTNNFPRALTVASMYSAMQLVLVIPVVFLIAFTRIA